jgi:hypothetical protein
MTHYHKVHFGGAPTPTVRDLKIAPSWPYTFKVQVQSGRYSVPSPPTVLLTVSGSENHSDWDVGHRQLLVRTFWNWWVQCLNSSADDRVQEDTVTRQTRFLRFTVWSLITSTPIMIYVYSLWLSCYLLYKKKTSSPRIFFRCSSPPLCHTWPQKINQNISNLFRSDRYPVGVHTRQSWLSHRQPKSTKTKTRTLQ